MAIQLVVPPVGESVVEVTISQWNKNEGDHVDKDEMVVVLDSEKTSFELPAPEAGTLTRILQPAGKTVAIGTVLAELEPGATAEPRKEPPTPVEPPVKEHAPAGPAARHLAAEQGIDLRTVEGSGRGGRILKEDVAVKVEQAKAPPPPPKPTITEKRAERVVPMSPLRKTVAARLVQVQSEAAILTTFNEIDMSAVLAMREAYKETFQQRHGVKLGFMGFFVKASIEALKQFPALNCEIRGDDMVFKEFYDIGVAVGGGKGLVVPIIRDADQLSFAQMEKTITDFGQRARDNKLKLEELTGGTFTISNGGVYGSMMSTPILNPPQTGILGMHKIMDRPVVVRGQILVRPMMYVALSYDHRAVDGREAVQFLVRVKECIEAPERMLLEA